MNSPILFTLIISLFTAVEMFAVPVAESPAAASASPLPSRIDMIVNKTLTDADQLNQQLESIRSGDALADSDAITQRLARIASHNKTANAELAKAQKLLSELKAHVAQAAALRAKLTESRQMGMDAAQEKLAKADIAAQYKKAITMYQSAAKIVMAVLDVPETERPAKRTPVAAPAPNSAKNLQQLDKLRQQTLQDVDELDSSLAPLVSLALKETTSIPAGLDGDFSQLAPLIVSNNTAAHELVEVRKLLSELRRHVNAAATVRQAESAESDLGAHQELHKEVRREVDWIKGRFAHVSALMEDLRLASEERQRKLNTQ